MISFQELGTDRSRGIIPPAVTPGLQLDGRAAAVMPQPHASTRSPRSFPLVSLRLHTRQSVRMPDLNRDVFVML
jgi:hypothetical protein